MNYYKKKNIIFTGSSGTIVQNILIEFLAIKEFSNYKILFLSSKEVQNNNINNINNFDYLDVKELDRILNKETIFIHFAAVTRSDKDQSKYQQNLKITK